MFTWIAIIFTKYGYIVLISSLFLEMIALPLPGEALMSYTGFLAYQGQFSWRLSIIAASLGAILGMTLSYWIGYWLGNRFFEKYGKYIHMGPERLRKTSIWFKKYGNKLLIIAYFIPGVRHITGYFSGITQIPFRTFATYAYTGAIIWVSTFISLGKILGPQWEQFHNSIKRYLIIGGITLAIGIAIIYIYRTYKLRLKERLESKLQQAIATFHTLGHVKILITIASIVFLGLFMLMIGLIQDFISNEFVQFNEITILLVNLIFKPNWDNWMSGFRVLVLFPILIPLILITWLWIMIKSNDRKLESLFLAIVVIGGEVLNESLRFIFHRLSPIPIDKSMNTFPSEQSLMAIVIYGFTVFLLLRHTKNIWLHNISIFIVFIILILIGISSIYFQIEAPSDVVGGYVFGGVWLSLNVILLEVYRLLRKMSKKNQ
ncbi:VTT domain-containing protein [Tepidibacillus sp. LV47]|uniref:VTT domain-containing protein n=1 Tax=Tepidibacillus sp. LV47 TaxID=3398228 RepID=UPI003AB04504